MINALYDGRRICKYVCKEMRICDEYNMRGRKSGYRKCSSRQDGSDGPEGKQEKWVVYRRTDELKKTWSELKQEN